MSMLLLGCSGVAAGGGAALSLAASSLFDTGDCAATPSCTSLSPGITLTATGGSGGYTYSSSRLSGDTGTTIIGGTTTTPYWRRLTATVAGSPYISTWRLTVTDSSSATASVDISVDMWNSF